MLDLDLALILRLVLHDGEELLATLTLLAREPGAAAWIAKAAPSGRLLLLALRRRSRRTRLLRDRIWALVPTVAALLAETGCCH